MCRKSSGIWLSSQSGSFSAQVLYCCLCIGLLLLPSPIFGLSPNEQLSSIELKLMAILAYSQKLGEELQTSQRISEEQNQQINMLLNELLDLRIKLETSKDLLSKYKNRVGELVSIIERLEMQLKTLSTSYEDTVRPLQQALKLAEKQIRRQRIEKWAITILVGAAAGYVGYQIGRAVK